MIALIMVIMAMVGVIIVALLFVFVLKHAPKIDSENAYLLAHGLPAKGKIILVEETGRMLPGTSYPIVKLTVQIYLPSEPTYNSTIEVPVSHHNFPSVGMPVTLKIDPQKKEVFMFAKSM